MKGPPKPHQRSSKFGSRVTVRICDAGRAYGDVGYVYVGAEAARMRGVCDAHVHEVRGVNPPSTLPELVRDSGEMTLGLSHRSHG